MILRRKTRRKFREAVEKYKAWHPDLWKTEAKIKELLKTAKDRKEGQLLKKELQKTRKDITDVLREIKRGIQLQ